MTVVILTVLFMAIAARLSAQTPLQQDQLRQVLVERLGVSAVDADAIGTIVNDAEPESRLAQAELAVLRAQIAREMVVAEDADLRAIERLLREGAEWEVRLRLIQIRREVELRKLLGDQSYRRVSEVLQRLGQQGAERRSQAPATGDSPQRTRPSGS